MSNCVDDGNEHDGRRRQTAKINKWLNDSYSMSSGAKSSEDSCCGEQSISSMEYDCDGGVSVVSYPSVMLAEDARPDNYHGSALGTANASDSHSEDTDDFVYPMPKASKPLSNEIKRFFRTMGETRKKFSNDNKKHVLPTTTATTTATTPPTVQKKQKDLEQQNGRKFVVECPPKPTASSDDTDDISALAAPSVSNTSKESSSGCLSGRTILWAIGILCVLILLALVGAFFAIPAEHNPWRGTGSSSSNLTNEQQHDPSTSVVVEEGDDNGLQIGQTITNPTYGRAAAKNGQTKTNPTFGSFELLETLPHDSSAYTQGLQLVDGVLYEGTGLYGKSEIRITDLDTGKVKKSTKLDRNFFGEGLTYYTDHETGEGRLIQLTWKAQTGFIYDSKDLKVLEEFKFSTTTNEGWGITHNPTTNHFIVSDGSQYLLWWDPTKDRKLIKQVVVTRDLEGTNADTVVRLNELEWDPKTGTILANIYGEDFLVRIDPTTGLVLTVYDLGSLFPQESRPDSTDVLNGIALADSKNGDEIWVTGKLWPNMYRIRLVDP